MFDSVINYLDKFAPEVLVIQSGFIVILSTLFMWLWFSNRRKYHNLKHAIPANVVKNYLDSIIQNSTALKSSLFRGGGLDVNATLTGIPSVLPLQGLGGGESLGMSGAPSTALLEDLNQKKAMIASLEAQLSAAQNAQRDFEAKWKESQANLAKAEARIKELEAMLAQKGTPVAAAPAGNDGALKTELAAVTKERDELRDRLREFEIISDDLANLKRLQQENEQLKRSLAAQGGGAPKVAEAAPAKAPMSDVSDLLEDLGQKSEEPLVEEGTNALEDFLSSPTPEAQEDAIAEPAAEVAASAPAAEDDNKKSEKTPEDLLSEFEKMLG